MRILRIALPAAILSFVLLFPPTARAATNHEYVTTTIATSSGSFAVKYIRISLANPNVRVYTLTGTSGDCTTCITKPLASYVQDAGGFAGIHGSYFCPPDYPSCAGKVGSYYWLWYNTLTKIFTNSRQNQFNTGGSLVAFDTSNTAYFFRTAPDFTAKSAFEDRYGVTLQALFSNGPGLIYNGQNITATFPLDDKQRTVKGTRGGVGLKGNDIYLLLASSATVPDLGAIMQSLGMTYAINLDGGGSSALWYNDAYKVGPGRELPNAIVFAEVDSTIPPAVAAPGSSFYAYEENLRGGFAVAGGDVTGDSRDEIITGTGSGLAPHVRVFSGDGTVRASFFAFDQSHTSGVRVAACDIDGDGTGEILAAEGRGQLPRVRVYAASGTLIREFPVLDGRFTGGVHVACGDTNGDGTPEVMVSASRGGGPQIMVYTATGQAIVNFFAYDQSFHGGVNMTAIDMDGDGHDEIVTGPEVGAPHVKIFQIRSGSVHRLSPGFYAFHPMYRGGVGVAGADLDGDGTRELLVAPSANAAPLVKAYSVRDALVDSFYAFPPSFLGGVQLGGGDTNGDGKEEVLAIPASAGSPQVRIIPR